MLFLSYHIGKDFTKIEKTGAALGYEGIAHIKRTALFREFDDIFRSVEAEHAVHRTIYRVYCACLTTLFLWSLLMHATSPRINPWNSLRLGLCWISYSFAVFYIRVCTKQYVGNFQR